MATVNANMFSAGVRADPHPQPLSLMSLPLNLVALILSYLDDVADLSRLCRTCRILNYMTLPQLYKTITLTSYDKIRYRDELPEGCGSASPFSMGLNAVVTRNVASLVRSFTMRGEWREDGLEEHARVGRVPDSSMMLNIAVRAAIDRMASLEKFSWELNTKMLETAYIGLAQLPKLTSLTVRFPSSRHPRPTTILPPMPHLRSLKVTDIDPLCYPDDISTLLLHSKKLRELKMHWSPRMREAQEPSVTLHDYFRKCIAAKSPLRIRKIALQNFYALHTDDFETAMDPAYLEDITTLNSPGVYDASVPATSFVDNSWPAPNKLCHNIKSLRHDRIERKGCEFLACLNNLERLYFVTPVRDPTDSINSPRTAEQSHSSASLTPPSRTEPNGANTNGVFTNNSAQMPAASPMSLASHIALRDAHINTITTVHGPKLRHLLLPSRWALPAPMIARLVHSCPNLEQLALATDLSSFDTLGLLIPFLRKLAAIRLLIPTGPASTTTALSKPHTNGITANGTVTQKVSPLDAQSLSEIVEMDDRIFNEAMGSRLADKELFSKLKIIGLGWKAWELGEFYTIPVTEKTSVYEFNSSPDLAMLNNGTSSITRKNTEPVSAGPSNSRAAPILSPHISPVSRSRGPRPSTSHAAIDCNTPKSVLGKRKEPPSSGSAPSTTLLPPTSYSTPTPSHNPIITPSSHAPANGLSAPAPHSTASVLEKLGPQLWLSEETRAKLTSCLPEPPRIGESVLFRRKVRRVGWDVVKNWEIWGLDVQEI